MTWIHKQWDEEYITMAEAKIRQMVSLFIYIVTALLSYTKDARVP
jgi:hypothetical protein